MKRINVIILLAFLKSVSGQELSFNHPVLSGSGCKEGATSTVMSPDNQSISILFDEFSAEVPQFSGENDNDESNDPELERTSLNPNLNHKLCNIVVSAQVPTGYRVKSLDVTYDFRGYTFAEKGAQTVFSSVLTGRSGLGMYQGPKGATQLERKNWDARFGDIDEDWVMSSTHSIPLQTQCASTGSGSVEFRMQNRIAARIGKRFQHLSPSGGIMMDSADITGSIRFKMHLEACHYSPGYGNRPRRPREGDRRPDRASRTQGCGRGEVYSPRMRRCIRLTSRSY